MTAHPIQATVRRLVVFLALALTGAAPHVAHAGPRHSADEAPIPQTIETFGLVSASAGWLLLDQRLYRTDDGGGTWTEITPPDLGQAAIRAAAFPDPEHGWLALTAPVGADNAGADNGPGYSLARTDDGGRTWQRLPLDLFAPGDPAALAGAVYLQFLDEQMGWLVVKRATSRNFSLGTLFRTDDGGATWVRLTLPIGEPVAFVSRDLGRVSGGAAGDEHYQTRDGGRTWQAVEAAPVASPEAAAPISGLAAVAMASAEIGWAKAVAGSCEPAAPSAEPRCTSTETLVRTADGGRTWTPLALPGGAPAAVETVAALPDPITPGPDTALNFGGRTRAVTGQGFDSCTLPTLAQMDDWYKNSPYRVWNLYIGGAARGNCGTLTADYLAALAVQGWRFIPTWVGPQAACAGFARRMSLDPAVAYTEGVAEANAAVERAAALGLTFADKTGSVLYYDLEAYDTKNTPCRDAAKAFISGWSGQLRARGHLAGVYGATCTSALSDFAGIAHVPDVIWAAYWLLPYQYRSNASVWNLPCLSNSLWTNSQRLRQYAGGHNETWGATTLNIDSNVLDGVVADLRYSSQPAVNPLELYLEPDYAGPDVCFVTQAGWFNASGCGPGWENQVSSLKLQAGWSARVYRDPDLGGPSVCYTLSDPDLANDFFDATTPVDNQLSSVKVYQHAGCLEPLGAHTLFLPVVTR